MDNSAPDSSPPPTSSKQILAHHGKSFYWASLFLGSELAERAAQLYQFCRFVDDLADGDLPDREESLEDIRARLDGGNRPAGPEIEAFIEFASHNNIPVIAARELLDGMLQDQQPTAVKDKAELLRYCHAVAGTVGLMMCRVLNCQHSRADAFAIDLGIAMQLTNISRDVLEDAKMGRRYLPATWVDLSPAEIVEAGIPCRQPVARAIEEMLDLAEDYYKSALLGIQLLPFRSRLAITVALRIYRQIGWVLRRQNLRWWQGRVYVAKSEKALLTLRSLRDLRPIWVPGHNRALHQDLQGLAGVDPSNHSPLTTDLDIAIIGGGSAGISLATKLKNQSAVVIEPRTAEERDCSWALWANPRQQQQFAQATKGSWQQWRLIDKHTEVLHQTDQYRYTSLSSADYIAQCETHLPAAVTLVRAPAEDIVATGNGGSFSAAGKHYRASQLYDSRPPALTEQGLKQHFVGWEIRTKGPISDPQIATLMDFRVDQSRGLHFIYVLPFSDRRLLIESTMISTELQDKDWYCQAMTQWLESQNIEIEETLREETGVIPMDRVAPIDRNIACIGAASGAVRLSSGYAFTSIQAQITKLAQGISAGDYKVPAPISPRLVRMDKIFNGVLLARPELGVSIMMRTAKALDGDGFARFMLGSATMTDWARVILAMPKIPFLKQVLRL
ncbi:MAG: squalene/phytoene synthase family protein [Porticoccaceae bacterium]|jgi:lycopene cyclase-like protein